MEEKLFSPDKELTHDVGYFKWNFTDVGGATTLDIQNNLTDAVYAYYGSVYRNTSTADKYSVIDTNHVFMWHNGSDDLYVNDTAVSTSSSPRDMVIKVVLAEIASNELKLGRQSILNVDAGGVTE